MSVEICENQQTSGLYPSAFDHYLSGWPDRDSGLIYNARTRTFLEVSLEAIQVLQALAVGDALDADGRQILADPEWSSPEIGILVPDLEQEAASYRAAFEASRNQGWLTVFWGINLACNFQCSYCCQANVMSGKVMDKPTIAEAESWIMQRFHVTDTPGIKLVFVGGEPLLHADRLIGIATRLRAFVQSQGADFEFALITNGYFLDAAMLDRLIAVGLTEAQITLDGDETTHAKTRIHKQGENTFHRIYDHAMAASKRIAVTINGNYTQDTAEGFESLIAMLRTSGFCGGTSFGPAFEMLDAPVASADGVHDWDSSDMSQRIRFWDQAVTAGMPQPPLRAVGPCGFHKLNTFAINVDGSILACPGFFGHPEWAIGHVASGLTDRYGELASWSTLDSCAGCSHHPDCAGGCIADRMLKTGAIDINCDKTYLDALTPHALPREFLMEALSVEEAVARLPEPPPSRQS